MTGVFVPKKEREKNQQPENAQEAPQMPWNQQSNKPRPLSSPLLHAFGGVIGGTSASS